MAAIQRLLVLGLIPILVFSSLQTFFPAALKDFQNALQPYLADTPFDFSSGPLTRSETPILVSVIDHYSHWEKTASIAKALADLGYPITFITGDGAKELTENLHPNIKYAPLNEKYFECVMEGLKRFMNPELSLVERENAIEHYAFVDAMEPAYETLQQHFREFRDEYGRTKPLIYLSDSLFTGRLPMGFGVPGLRPDSSLAILPHPHTLDSNDTYPFHTYKMPETGRDAKAIHWKAYQDRANHERSRPTAEHFREKLMEMGSTDVPPSDFFAAMGFVGDHLLKMGVPEFEFERSDLRDNVHYFGALKNKKESLKPEKLPVWWDDLLQAKKDGKKIVAVSQGTVAPDLTELVIPTLESLESRDDVLVIVSTVTVEPEEAPGLVLPANARAAKFVPYNYLLPLVDVLVNNAGYGAVMTSLSNGIPMVVGGEGQDKAVTALLIERSKVGVNLKNKKPGTAAVKAGLNKVLDDPSYKQNAMKMKKSFDSYDMLSTFDGVIQSVVKEWAAKRKNKNSS